MRSQACHQSPEISSPVQPHSAQLGELPELPSEFEEPEQNNCYVSQKNNHQSRKTNVLPDFQRNKEQRINFPPSSDPIWKNMNDELNTALPKIFNKKTMQKLSTQELIHKFDKWTHAFFLGKFGPIEDKKMHGRPREARPNKSMVRLREGKKRLRRTRKILQKAGLVGTREWNLVSKEWFAVVRRHSRLRRALLYRQQKRRSVEADRKFKADPYAYAKNLFKPREAAGKPGFSKEEAEAYFPALYHDEGRSHEYEALEEQPPLPPPKHGFNLRPPTLSEVFRSARRKKNGASPGVNALPYVPFKKCPALIKCLHKIFLKIWKTGEVPADWAVAYIALLAKSADLTSPAEFRPIAVTNTSGKIFFSIVSDRLQFYLVDNEYIKRRIQKGFLAGVAGCVEHTFGLWEALRNAKENQRAFVTTWIDLANAYGSVRHNLIQFALNWYHVPPPIQKLIFNYYEKLCAMIVTAEWKTGFFFLTSDASKDVFSPPSFSIACSTCC